MKSYIWKYPITSLLFAINTAMLVVMFLKGGFTVENFYYLGSFFKEVMAEKDYYRFITSMFLHGSFLHFAMNMVMLLAMANELEKLIGKLRYTILYFFSGIAGNVLIIWFGPAYTLSLGASGALYGVFGFFLYISLFEKYFTKEWNKQIYALVGVNLLITFIVPNISIWGHIGGLIGGFILAIPFSKQIEKFVKRSIQEKEDIDI